MNYRDDPRLPSHPRRVGPRATIHALHELPRNLRPSIYSYNIEVAPGVKAHGRYEPRCHVCRSPHRALVEQEVLFRGGSTRGVVKELPPGHGLSVDSIYRHHHRGHFPLRELLEHSHHGLTPVVHLIAVDASEPTLLGLDQALQDLNDFANSGDDEHRLVGLDRALELPDEDFGHPTEITGAMGMKLNYGYESRCKTCQSPYRREAELRVLRRLGCVRGVLSSLPKGHGITPSSFRRHLGRGHFPIRLIVRHALWIARHPEG